MNAVQKHRLLLFLFPPESPSSDVSLCSADCTWLFTDCSVKCELPEPLQSRNSQGRKDNRITHKGKAEGFTHSASLGDKIVLIISLIFYILISYTSLKLTKVDVKQDWDSGQLGSLNRFSAVSITAEDRDLHPHHRGNRIQVVGLGAHDAVLPGGDFGRNGDAGLLL